MSKPTLKSILLEARRLLAEEGWTQNSFARNHDGFAVDESSEEATCFCMIGAIRRANKSLNGNYNSKLAAYDLLHEAIAPRGHNNIAGFNDYAAKSVDDVLQVIDEAIEKCE